MRRKTTTKQLNAAITNNLLHITSAQKYYKSTHQTDSISPETFQESLEFLCESLFADCVGWHYEFDINTDDYEIECSRMDGSSDYIVIAHLCANENVEGEVIDMALSVIEEE